MAFLDVTHGMEFQAIEKRILDFWDTNDIFRKSVQSRPVTRPFIFYEGPPTANGKPGIHHVISRCIKDCICRYKTMQGYRVERKAGWDTHGLPVEIEVEKELGFTNKDQIEKYGVDKFNQKCRESVLRYLQLWNTFTRRIGYWVDLENPYLTYTSEYIETVWWILAQMWKKDLLYKGFKILPYCPRCETALSSHEVALGYRDVAERALTVKFPLIDREGHFILAWTTTPWTLPGNVALAVGPDLAYVLVEQEKNGKSEKYYLAEERLQTLKGPLQILQRLTGQDMVGWKYRPLFDFVDLSDQNHPAYKVLPADFVTVEEGTGVVHTAVMYGEDDYRLGIQAGLPAVHTVDEQGRFNSRVSQWEGRHVKSPELEEELISYLKERGRLYKEEQYTHSYPFCWRCDSPLLYYAKKSWYLKTTAIRDRLIANNRTIRWFPREVGEGRFGQWLENNVDWSLSRDRYWGTPLNIWVCPECSSSVAVESKAALLSLSGISDIPDLHKPSIDSVTFPCPKCGKTMSRTPEVIDCWFDSGSMPYGQSHYPFANQDALKNHFPADFIAEGVDQTRGWFYSLLVISTIISDIPAYKSVMSIEMILDKDGQKMSKSKGNAVDPFAILDREGADPLRWYLYTVSPPWVPTRFDIDGVKEVIRRFFNTLMNTYSFFVLYANIDHFEPSSTPVPLESRPDIDRWLISSLNALVHRTERAMEKCDVTKTTRAIQDFVIDDLSNWYVRRNRRRFWKSEMGPDKLAAYQTLYESLVAVTKMIAPFVPFLSEEMYQNLKGRQGEIHESVHLSFFPDPSETRYGFTDDDLENKMRIARTMVALCRAARNDAGLKIRQPLARVLITSSEESRQAVETFEKLILDEINIRKIEWSSDLGSLQKKIAVPDFKKLGPKFGSEVNQVVEQIRAWPPETVEKLEKTGTVEIELGHGKNAVIVREDIDVKSEVKEGFAIQQDGDIRLAIDTVLDDELVNEGLVRELINRIQHMRKESDFNITDRIRICFEAEGVLKDAIDKKRQSIMDDVLASLMEEGLQKSESHSEWDIDGHPVRIAIRLEKNPM